MTDLLELADRCEKATGHDCELERDIAKEIGWRHLRNKGPTQDDEPYHWVAPDGTCHDGFPDYLTSLDAAMTLVPEGWAIQVIRTVNGKRGGANLYRFDDGHGNKPTDTVASDAATPALALCAAALRARASGEQTKP